jgi:transposase
MRAWFPPVENTPVALAIASKVTPDSVGKLIETLEKEPSELGYKFGKWTGERLATYLESRTGIKLTGAQVKKILKRKKYVYFRHCTAE